MTGAGEGAVDVVAEAHEDQMMVMSQRMVKPRRSHCANCPAKMAVDCWVVDADAGGEPWLHFVLRLPLSARHDHSNVDTSLGRRVCAPKILKRPPAKEKVVMVQVITKKQRRNLEGMHAAPVGVMNPSDVVDEGALDAAAALGMAAAGGVGVSVNGMGGAVVVGGVSEEGEEAEPEVGGAADAAHVGHPDVVVVERSQELQALHGDVTGHTEV